MYELTKEDLWKALTEPTQHRCENCKHTTLSWNECNKIQACSDNTFSVTCTRRELWEWDKISK